jgi:hypothetical protein
LALTVHRLQAIGGSHAQRDLFEQVYLDGWLRTSQNHEALRLLEKRVAAHRYVPSIEREPALTSKPLELIQFSTQKTIEKPAATLSKIGNGVRPDVVVKSRVIIKPNQATHWTEELSQTQSLALAKTYARIIEMGGHLSA